MAIDKKVDILNETEYAERVAPLCHGISHTVSIFKKGPNTKGWDIRASYINGFTTHYAVFYDDEFIYRYKTQKEAINFVKMA